MSFWADMIGSIEMTGPATATTTSSVAKPAAAVPDCDDVHRQGTTSAALNMPRGVQADVSSANRDADQQPESTGPSRRLACDPCRERKVRCDRQQPSCGRCARLRHECSYSSPSKQTTAKTDLSRLLMTLHSRLTQAEAQLAQRSLEIPFDVPWPDLGISPTTATTLGEPTVSSLAPIPTILPNSQAPRDFLSMPMDPVGDVDMMYSFMLDANGEWSNNASSSGVPAGIDSTMPDLPGAQSAPNNTIPVFDFNSISKPPSRAFSSSSSSETRSGPSASAIEAGLLAQLHAKFFEIFDPVLPMVNRARFQLELAQDASAIDVQGLSFAVAALGALAAPEFAFAQERCYNQARELLDMCERQEKGGSLANINALQTCVLLTLYEFRRPNFARSWMTLGRAIRLCKMMGLDRLDAEAASGFPPQPWDVHLSLPPVSSPSALEERRRTFWILYIFDASAAIRSGTETAFGPMQIPVRLPDAADLSHITEESTMPSLQQVESLPLAPTLPPFAGTALVVSLYRRCCEHVRLSRQPTASSSYPFWVAHYRLDRAISDCRARISPDYQGVLSITLWMNLAAVELWLHETALSKTEAESHLPPTLRTEAVNRCGAAAACILKHVRQGQQFVGMQRESFRISNVFIMWPMTLAMTVYRSLARRRTEQRERSISIGTTPGDSVAGSIISGGGNAEHQDAVRILVRALQELIPPELIPAGALEELDDVAAGSDVEQGNKDNKRRRTHSF
ncbi:hypothetical protein B0I35DRAFT_429421 [Stachybotrys elegans]|uniref:Zn(2)-C6 fungal-type domain-containing protein n=1 Tax=Stachybotrys elegans TaxID=80388 RepID=A0A8K0STE2_9HYPO|nr:hypothetical protein B0I35DRAFT_429421 [Stachybotrys elegans]